MKKNITINLFGQLYAIDEDAYALLEQYLENMKRYFARREGGAEIADDIEHRVAEIFADLKASGIEAVAIEHVQDIIHRIGNPEDMDEDSGETVHTSTQYAEKKENLGQKASQWFAGRKLYRDGEDKILGGVCSGICKYFGANDPLPWRIAMVLIALMSFSVVGILYMAAWCLVPVALSPEEKLRMQGKPVTPQTINEELMRGVKDGNRSASPASQQNAARTFFGTLLWIFVFCLKIVALFVAGCLFVCLMVAAGWFIHGLCTGGEVPPFDSYPKDYVWMALLDNHLLIWEWSCAILSFFVALVILLYGIVRSLIVSRNSRPMRPIVVTTFIILFFLTAVSGTVLTGLGCLQTKKAYKQLYREANTYDAIFIEPESKDCLDKAGAQITLSGNCNRNGCYVLQTYDFDDDLYLSYYSFRKIDVAQEMSAEIQIRKTVSQGRYHIEAVVQAPGCTLLSSRQNGNEGMYECFSGYYSVDAYKGNLHKMSCDEMNAIGFGPVVFTDETWNAKRRERVDDWMYVRTPSFDLKAGTVDYGLMLKQERNEDDEVKVLFVRLVKENPDTTVVKEASQPQAADKMSAKKKK